MGVCEIRRRPTVIAGIYKRYGPAWPGLAWLRLNMVIEAMARIDMNDADH